MNSVTLYTVKSFRIDAEVLPGVDGRSVGLLQVKAFDHDGALTTVSLYGCDQQMLESVRQFLGDTSEVEGAPV